MRTYRAPHRGPAHRFGVALTAGALVLATASCAAAGAGTRTVDNADTLVIGVARPLHGNEGSGAVSTFDAKVAGYIGKRLGHGRPVEVKPVTEHGDPARTLRDTGADMVIDARAITPERKRGVLFAGPYYVGHDDILVRSGDTAITGLRDLAGKRLCRVRGGATWQRVSKLGGIAAKPVDAPDYDRCVQMLRDGELDAVTTDDLVLAGYVNESKGALRVVNAPFSDERYGVAVRGGDAAGCAAVNRAITSMYEDATAQLLLADNFGDSGLETGTEVPQFEGCS